MSKSVKLDQTTESKHKQELHSKAYKKMADATDFKTNLRNDADPETERLDPDQDALETKRREFLTPEQIEEIEKKTIETIQQKMADVTGLDSYVTPDSNGHFPVQVRNLCLVMYSSYFALKGAPLEIMCGFRRKVSKIMIDTKAVDIICEICKYYVVNGWTKEEYGKKITDKTKWLPFENASTLLLNYSDASSEFAVYLASYPGLLQSLVHVLVERKDAHLKQEQGKHAKFVTWRAVEIPYNISMVDGTVHYLRDLDFTSVMKPYLKSPDEMIKLNALATLASIVDENESEIINANRATVELLLVSLRKGLESEIRRHNQISCKESAYAVRMLARNDANKKMLYELGAVELLVKLGQTGDDEEKYESVNALWALSFDKEIRQKMVKMEDLGIVELLQDIRKTCHLPAITNACAGTLWIMRDDLMKSTNENYQKLGRLMLGDSLDQVTDVYTKKKAEKDTGHIMISYQWANQKTLVKVRDVLLENGFKVWMDIDQMTGSTLQAMADAVENSTIFIMSMSQKYKDSPNCRAEAEYAFTKHKTIIPLVMESGYRADGWLGFILGAKLYFDLSGKYPFENKMVDLVKEINNINGIEVKHHTPVTRGDTPDSSHDRLKVVSKETVSIIRQWTRTDVEKWVNKHDLKSCGLANLTGGEVALLMTLRIDAPDFFYRCLQTMLNVNDLLTMSKIVWALSDLTEGMD